MRNISKLLFVLILLFSGNLLGQSRDSLLIALVHTNSLKTLDSLVSRVDVDDPLGQSQEPLLFYAIQENNLEAVKLLIKKGASIEMLFSDLNALMNCSIKGRTAIGAYLISIGANVNSFNSRRNTALIYAARYGRLPFVKLLLDNGANAEVKNITNISALDYAEKFAEVAISEQLRLTIENKYIPFKPSFRDGPHVFTSMWNSFTKEYLNFDSSSQKFTRTSEAYKYQKGSANLLVNESIGEVTVSFNQPRAAKHHKSNYSKIFAVGDVHGAYDSLLVLLTNNGVIDHNTNWTFDDGVLVFVGDIFDRGNQVTECLWLIYKLQDQAIESGGTLFWTLGNHEIMELEGDTRYLHNNYLLLTTKNKTTYMDLFGKESLLGLWIRQQQTVVRIGNFLFSHAGISPQLIKNKFTIGDINSLVNRFVNRKQLDPTDIERISLLVGEYGPFWYRGYVQSSSYAKKLDSLEVASINLSLNVSVQIIGHTEVNQIEPSYGGSVIPIDVSFASPQVSIQGLYIEADKFYRALRDGNKVFLFSISKD